MTRFFSQLVNKFYLEMAEINLITTNRKYLDYAECNITFLNRVSKQRKESQYIDIVQVRKKITSITSKLAALDQSQLNEWKDIHMAKLRELANLFRLKNQNTNIAAHQSKNHEYSSSLRQQLHIIVQSCKIVRSNSVKTIVEYNSEEVAEIIQQFYFREYKDEILHIMEQAGYNTSRFRVLQYQQPSFFSFCCCWETKIK